ncbi:MAG: zf-TFIIB domain-containing protein [Polyangiaceae bacterium]|jgi:hypothetical protein|nr:zf-TFIIB domain-containing protein [Polyangiaceae bacterium]
MKCPRDATVLQPFMVEGRVQVDRCSTCRGLWLDNGDLEQIQETIERDHGNLPTGPMAMVAASFAKARQERLGPVPCPRCAKPMETREYGYNSQVIIDACPGGCGMWLDQGELARLEAFYEKGREENPLPLRWRLWADVVSVFRNSGSSGNK